MASSKAAKEPALPSPRRKNPRPSSGTTVLSIFSMNRVAVEIVKLELALRDWPGSLTCRRAAAEIVWPSPRRGGLSWRASAGKAASLAFSAAVLGTLLQAPGVAEENAVAAELSPRCRRRPRPCRLRDRPCPECRASPSKTMTQGRPFLKSISLNFRCPMKCATAPSGRRDGPCVHGRHRDLLPILARILALVFLWCRWPRGRRRRRGRIRRRDRPPQRRRLCRRRWRPSFPCPRS